MTICVERATRSVVARGTSGGIRSSSPLAAAAIWAVGTFAVFSSPAAFAAGGPQIVWQIGGHSARISDLDISPDGTEFVSASDDGSMKKWRISDGALLRSYSVNDGTLGGTFSMEGVTYQPDGQVVWGTSVGGGYSFDAMTGRQLSSLGEFETGGRVLFSPDGQYIALAGNPVGFEDVTEVYRRSDGQRLHTFQPGGNVAAVFTPDSQYLVTGTQVGFQSAAGVIRYYRLSDGQLIRTINAHADGINWLEISPDGLLLASCSKDDTIKLWNVADGSFVRTLTGHTNDVYRARFSPDGVRFASTSFDGTIRFWNLQTGAQVDQFLPNGGGGIGAFDWSPDGDTIVLASGALFSETHRALMLIDSHTGAVIRQFLACQGTLTDLSLSFDRSRVAFVPYPGVIQCRSTVDGSSVWNKSLTPLDHRLAFTADGSRLAAGGNDGVVRFFSSTTGALQGSFAAHSGTMIDIAMAPDGALLATRMFNDVGKIWNQPANSLMTTIPAINMTNGSFIFSTDSQSIYWGGTNAVVQSRASDGGLIRSFTGHTGTVRDIALNGDGTLLVSGSLDATARLWNARTGAFIRSFGPHPTTVSAVAITPDGRFIATGTVNIDRRLRLWNAETGEMIAEYEVDMGGGVVKIAALDNDHFVIARRDSSVMCIQIPAPVTTGDIDGDGDIDLDDAEALAAVLVDLPLSPDHAGRADVNDDGIVNGADIDDFVQFIVP